MHRESDALNQVFYRGFHRRRQSRCPHASAAAGSALRSDYDNMGQSLVQFVDMMPKDKFLAP